MKQREMEETAARRLLDVLGEVPFFSSVKVQPQTPGKQGAPLTVLVRSGGDSRRLSCEVNASGQPRIVRDACLRLREAVASDSRSYPVFVAPFLSSAAAAICDEYGVGYSDLAGNCRLVFDQVFIHRWGFPNASVQRRDLRSLYSPKAERVLRVLLNAGPRNWRMQELADEADVSLGQVANVKKLLLDREWIESEPKGLRLRSWEGAALPLLAEWAAMYRAARNRAHDFYSLRPIPEVEAAIASQPGVALTGFSGAARRAPVVRYQRVAAYVKDDVVRVAEAAGLKPVPSGANVTLLEPYDHGVFYGAGAFGSRPAEDCGPAVSAVQLYLDLFTTKGRGEEAARAILAEAIAPLWGIGWGH